jgi:cytochrome c-type biogenesis protein CcmH
VTPALAFILAALVLMGLVAGILGWAMWQGSKQGVAQAQAEQDMVQANAAVYRDQLAELERERQQGQLTEAEFALAHDELSQRLLEDVTNLTTTASPSSSEVTWRKPRLWVAALGLCLPIGAMLMYSSLGQPAGMDPVALRQGVNRNDEVTPEKLTEMATALMRRLQDEPNSAEGWVMLGRVQRARGRFDEADEAFRRALDLTHDDNLAIERAEVLAQKNGGVFAGEPWAIIQRVLAADPHHLNALFLAGSASFAELNYRSALRFWERAREVVPADSPDAPELDRAIAEASEKLGIPPAPPKAQARDTKPAAVSQASISGRVSLLPELAGLVAPTDTVFVYATPVTGSRMPVAIVRTTVAKLPFDFVLDDSTSMDPSNKLSAQAEVTVRVRISKSGQAMAQPGDYGVSLTPVKPGAKGLNLLVREPLH